MAPPWMTIFNNFPLGIGGCPLPCLFLGPPEKAFWGWMGRFASLFWASLIHWSRLWGQVLNQWSNNHPSGSPPATENEISRLKSLGRATRAWDQIDDDWCPDCTMNPHHSFRGHPRFGCGWTLGYLGWSTGNTILATVWTRTPGPFCSTGWPGHVVMTLHKKMALCYTTIQTEYPRGTMSRSEWTNSWVNYRYGHLIKSFVAGWSTW